MLRITNEDNMELMSRYEDKYLIWLLLTRRTEETAAAITGKP